MLNKPILPVCSDQSCGWGILQTARSSLSFTGPGRHRGASTLPSICWRNTAARHKQNLVSLWICLKEFHGIKPWSKETSKRAGWYSRITSSKLKRVPSHWAGSQVKIPGGLHGWTRCSSQNQTQKWSIQKVEAETSNLGEIQKHCLSMQRWV